MFETNILISSMILSSIGMGYFIYGKKQQKYVTLFCGVILMVYPYFITNIYYMLGIGFFLLISPFIENRFFS